MNESTEKFGLEFAERNMLPFYTYLEDRFSDLYDKCPTIYRVKKLPRPYIKSEDNVFLMTGGNMSLEEIINAEANTESLDSFSWGDEAFLLYNSAVFVAQNTGLHFIPQIIPIEMIPGSSDFGGISLQTSTGKTYLIGIKKSLSFPEKLHELHHELRHAYQHEFHPEYFADYDMDLLKKDPIKYFLQPAEVDAEAYATIITNKVLDLNGGNTHYHRKKYAAVNDAVNKRIKELLPEVIAKINK